MYQRDINQYLKMYPELLKWINECPACHIKGYKPDMPLHIGEEWSIAGYNFRKYFKPLEVDNFGFCIICSNFRER